MINFEKIITNEKSIYLFDQGLLKKNKLFDPFIFTDILTHYAGIQSNIILHFWQLDQTMILGMKDTRVPRLNDGIRFLKKEQYDIVIRNAGGLGVIADNGILNFSIILPTDEKQKYTIDEAYTFMFEWIKLAFKDFLVKIDAFEITTSYCPGTFDLSIDGKKFAGIAQRRIKNGLAVMIYLSVTGDQRHRGEIVRSFYQESLGAAFGTNGYPPVEPDVMANLEDLLQTKLTITEVKQRLESVLNPSKINKTSLLNERSTNYFETEYSKQSERMTQRNQLLE